MEQARTEPPRSCDVVVVGAGIVGLAVARELSRRIPDASIAVLEREQRIARHQSGHSSGVIHAGIYYSPGSLKARLCVEGARRLYSYCEERGVEARAAGKLIVASKPAELSRLDELERRGVANGVPGLSRLGAEEAREIEPACAPLAALHSPQTGIVDFALLAAALATDVRETGGVLALGCSVHRAVESGGSVMLEHAGGRTEAAHAVLCAGPWADRLAISMGAPADPRIVPFRGRYWRVGGASERLVRESVYPVPDPAMPFLGAHLTRGIGGDLMAGPTALLAATRESDRRTPDPRELAAAVAWPGSWRMALRNRRAAAAELSRALSRRALARELARLVPQIAAADLERAGSGIRAQALARDGSLVDDFVLHATERTLHVRNAPSPAATACLALAEEIVDRLPLAGTSSS